MKKFFMMISLVCIMGMFASCDTDDGYWYDQGPTTYPTQALNSYEKELVGSYVSDDDKEPFYLVLNNDRTGYYKTGSENANFYWKADSRTLTVYYKDSNTSSAMNYYYKDTHLYVDGIPLVENNGGETGPTTNSALVGQWQGEIKNYYQYVYPDLDKNGQYATVVEFANDGYGAQLDYDEYNPKANYSYMPFQWMSNGTAVILYFGKDADGNDIPTGTISDFALTSTRFTGQVAYGSISYGFAYNKTTGFDWTPYQAKASNEKTTALQLLRELKAKGSKKTAIGQFAGR